jgi:tight adherence protein C
MKRWWVVTTLSVLDAVLWGLGYWNARPSRVARRLRRYVARSPVPVRPKPLGQHFMKSLSRFGAFLRQFSSDNRRRGQNDLLERAGIDWDPELLDAVRVTAAGVGAVLVGTMGYFGFGRAAPIGLLLGAGAGYFAPVLWLRRRVDARQRAFRGALPDALDVLVICLRAGLGFHAAVAEYVHSAQGVVAGAFHKYLSDLSLGRSVEEAWAEMSRLYPGEDLAVLSTHLIQALRMGTPVTDALEVQASHARALARQRAEEGARSLSAKLVLPLIAFIFPQVFLIGLGPVALRLFGPGGPLR